MNGIPEIIDKLNYLLSTELTAINQYMVHAEMCDNWGYTKLHDYIEARARTEMKHAQLLIYRIIFLNGHPTVSKLNGIYIGSNVVDMHKFDTTAETDAVSTYNEAVKLAMELKDDGTRELLESILKDEETHLDDLEARNTQIGQMGLQNYLSIQV